jgi:pimeloyl-ACP methyl ester carboxylesterase
LEICFMAVQSAHHVAPNLFVTASNGVRYAYRRFGKSRGTPLLLLQHFRGGLDNWDPLLTDTISAEREVILFDNTGVGLSGGTPPKTIAEMARDAIAFLDSLKLERVDVLGFSLGGFVAQEVALLRPLQVRKLILAGTGPQGGPSMHGWRKDIADAARKPEIGGEELLYIFFAHTPASQAKGKEYLSRFLARTEDRSPMCTTEALNGQYDAVVAWGIPDHDKLASLASIAHPTLAANGDSDLMIPAKLTHLMGGLIPDVRVTIYPDAAHGFLFQYPVEFATEVLRFLAD